jgi:hypothetical protein
MHACTRSRWRSLRGPRGFPGTPRRKLNRFARSQPSGSAIGSGTSPRSSWRRSMTRSGCPRAVIAAPRSPRLPLPRSRPRRCPRRESSRGSRRVRPSALAGARHESGSTRRTDASYTADSCTRRISSGNPQPATGDRPTSAGAAKPKDRPTRACRRCSRCRLATTAVVTFVATREVPSLALGQRS